MPCYKCSLHTTSRCNNLKGKVGVEPKLAIILDSPNIEENRRQRMGYGQMYELLIWLLKRMSISRNDVYISYALKCYKPKDKLKKKPERLQAIKACLTNEELPASCTVVLTSGSISCEAYVRGKQLVVAEGRRFKEKPRPVYVAYSLGYCIKTPKQTPRLYRLLWTACEEAGLKPVYDPELEPFDYDL